MRGWLSKLLGVAVSASLGVVLVGSVSVAAIPRAGSSTAGIWHSAIEVPGAATLNHGLADATSISCASSGNCSVGGWYTNGSYKVEAFVANEASGSWHSAIEVPGTATLNKGGLARVLSVSCASAGNCSAAGDYTDGASKLQAFVANETNGTWHSAVEVPGTATLNKGGWAGLSSISCASSGNCSAGGWYKDGLGHQQVFVVNRTSGTWHSAIEVPGTATLNKGENAGVSPGGISCASAGNCSVGGNYSDGAHKTQAFVANETNGSWHSAIEVPGTATLNKGGYADTNSLSCASAGNCSAGGSYTDGAYGLQGFVANETNGTWHSATEVPGTATLNKGALAGVLSVSCGSAGNCSAAGFYSPGPGSAQDAFVANETNGSWHSAIEVPGTATLNKGGEATVNSVSCASAGNCSLGGSYWDATSQQAFVANETNGSWHSAVEVPGTAKLNSGNKASADWVSCASASNCAAGGSFRNSSGDQPFVVNET